MTPSRGAPPDAKITVDEMRGALQRSGYLLESRLATVLRARDFRVETNAAYRDPATGKSRELDLHARYMRGWSIGPAIDDILWPELVIECVHPPQPIAFISHPSSTGILSPFDPVASVRICGAPRHSPDDRLEESWSWLPGVAGFREAHHYGKGVLSTQFCSFEQKRNASEWMARHREEDHEAFTKLCDALDFHVAEFYRTIYEPDEPRDLQLAALYPVMVVEGELYQVRAERPAVRMRRTHHVRYHRTRIVGAEARDLPPVS